MKRVFCLFTLSMILISCKKENLNGSRQVVVTYEVVSNAQILTTPGITKQVNYVNATGQQVWEDWVGAGNKWTKTITITTSTRPLLLFLMTSQSFNSAGTLTGNIYVNNVLKANAINPLMGSSNIYAGSIILNFWLQ